MSHQSFFILHEVLNLSVAHYDKLLEREGSFDQIILLPYDETWELPKRAKALWGKWAHEGLFLRMQKENISFLPYFHESYPSSLRKLTNPPAALYLLGDISHLNGDCLAVVGTRNATTYGLEMAYSLSKTLANADVTIISGLARGIDTAAHTGALEKGNTVAFIGSGLLNIYPPENKLLVKKMTEKGAVISQFPLLANPEKYHFPERNRLVSHFSKSICIIEAPLKSGALITADFAYKEGKPIFALPGRADVANFQGNHLYLKQGKARIFDTPDDLLQIFNKKAEINVTSSKSSTLTEEEVSFISLFPDTECSMEEIVGKTKLPIAKLNVLLMRLILKSVVKELPGKFYKKVVG